MNCEQTRQLFEQAQPLSDEQQSQYDSHLADCHACQTYVASENLLNHALRELPEPAAPARIMKQAMRQISIQQRLARLKVVNIGVGLAFAASLMVAVIMPALFEPAQQQDVVSAITMSMNSPRTVNIQFDSPEQVDEAVIIVSLPQNLRVAGYEHNSELRWTTALKAGKNSLQLPLVASSEGTGLLRSALMINGKSKEFTLQVDVSTEQSPTSEMNNATV